MKSELKKYRPILVLIVGSLLVWLIVVFYFADDYIAQFINSEEPYTLERETAFYNFYYAMSLIWGLLAVYTFVLCINVFSLKTITGKIWLLLTVAMVLWFLGDLYYALEWFINHNTDLPSIHFGRVCYIIGFSFILVGLAAQLMVGGLKIPKKEFGYITIIEGIFLTFSLVCIVLVSQLEVYEDFGEFDKGILVFYLIFDEVNIFLSIILIFKYRGGQFSRGWLIISIGFMVEATYDMLYIYMDVIFELENAWYFFDPVYYLMYVVLAVGALYLFLAVRSAHA